MYQSQTLVFFVQSMSSDLIFWFFLGDTLSNTWAAPSMVLGVTLGHARGTKWHVRVKPPIFPSSPTPPRTLPFEYFILP